MCDSDNSMTTNVEGRYEFGATTRKLLMPGTDTVFGKFGPNKAIMDEDASSQSLESSPGELIDCLNTNLEERCDIGDTIQRLLLGIDTESRRPVFLTEQASSTESPLLVTAEMIAVAEKEMLGWQKVLDGLICLKAQQDAIPDADAPSPKRFKGAERSRPAPSMSVSVVAGL